MAAAFYYSVFYISQTSHMHLPPPASAFRTAARFGFPPFPPPAMQGTLAGADKHAGTKAEYTA
ncbi:hypothetical protein BEI62_05490 [Eisenbergiella tayi]|nr:hypothetical protein BEI62_05490 [Eisenbergiella tayi]